MLSVSSSNSSAQQSFSGLVSETLDCSMKSHHQKWESSEIQNTRIPMGGSKSKASKRLCSCDLHGLAQYIKANEGNPCFTVVVLLGAGASTSAGIPDFRSKGSGLYGNLQEYDLPRPQMMFDLDYFKSEPAAFYKFAQQAAFWPSAYQPTPTHHFIALLEARGMLRRCYTQNIDSLERRAGVSADKIVAAHGNFDSATCLDTGEKVPIAKVEAAIKRGEWKALRDEFGGLVKPDVVFFGEQLPPNFFSSASEDLARCDLLLVVGTSLAVAPFNDLIHKAREDCVRVLVNREKVALRGTLSVPGGLSELERALGVDAFPDLRGFAFDEEDNERDVCLLGDCDDQIYALCEELGWAEQLRARVRGNVSSA